jgi:hypothetical protein
MFKKGEIVIAIIFLVAFSLGGSLYYVFKHSPDFRGHVANQLEGEFKTFLSQKGFASEDLEFTIEIRKNDLALLLPAAGDLADRATELEPLFAEWVQNRFPDRKSGKAILEVTP